MAKKVIGFIPAEKRVGFGEQKGEEEKVVLGGIEKEFQHLLSALHIEKRKLTKNLRLEKKIKRELVKLHKRILKLRKLVEERSTVIARINAIYKEDTKKALSLIEKVEELDASVGPMSQAISDDLNKHALPEIAELYKGVNLSREEIAAIREIAVTLGIRLNQIMAPVNIQEAENMRRNIAYFHRDTR